ncbi:hypothetical protein K9L97_01070 [Candidatus Woesearchaeota archaeon]|nr:hypothetical protein [Candidatus Woesearchaeota archaeon]
MGFFGFGKKKEENKTTSENTQQPKLSPLNTPLNPQKTTTVNDENASFQVPDFSEDDLDFDLDVNEFLPEMDKETQIDSNQIKEQQDLNKILNQPTEETKPESSKIIEKKEIQKETPTQKTNKQEQDEFNQTNPEDQQLNTSEYKNQKQNKNKFDNLNTSPNLNTSNAPNTTQNKELPKFKTPKPDKNKEYIEKENYKNFLKSEEEIKEESNAHKEILSKINKHQEQQDQLYKETEKIIETIKSKLMDLDERIFEINQQV